MARQVKTVTMLNSPIRECTSAAITTPPRHSQHQPMQLCITHLKSHWAGTKMKISLIALEKRMSGALLKNGIELRCCSERSANFENLGYWFGINVENNSVDFSKWDITALESNAREMGVMLPHESLAA